MNILEWILLLLLMLFVDVIVPAIALIALWDIIAFIVFLATLKGDEAKHKKAKLSELPNIGEKVEKQLNDVGIYTYEDLAADGAEKVCLKIQAADPSACIHRLLALEGALQGIPKKLLPEERKAEFKKFYTEHKITK